MHEFSLCRGVLKAVLEELERLDPPANRLVRARLEAGRLHQIVPAYLQSAWELLVVDTPAAGSALDLAIVPVTGRCKACDWSGEIEPPVFLCPACTSGDLDIDGGNEFRLTGLDVEIDDD